MELWNRFDEWLVDRYGWRVLHYHIALVALVVAVLVLYDVTLDWLDGAIMAATVLFAFVYSSKLRQAETAESEAKHLGVEVQDD